MSEEQVTDEMFLDEAETCDDPNVSALESFYYKQGEAVELEGIDLGRNAGIKLTMSHAQYGEMAILLDAEGTEKLLDWLLNVMCREINQLPKNRLMQIIERILGTTGMVHTLKSGDKTALKNTLHILTERYKNETITTKS